jgi:hypothetical protein
MSKPAKKKYARNAKDFQPLAEGYGGCIASDRITVDDMPVGYFFRDKSQHPDDSGWMFVAGDESEDYMKDHDKHGIYDVNSIANYDPEIVPFLDAPVGCGFERQKKGFVQVQGKKWKPALKRA